MRPHITRRVLALVRWDRRMLSEARVGWHRRGASEAVPDDGDKSITVEVSRPVRQRRPGCWRYTLKGEAPPIWKQPTCVRPRSSPGVEWKDVIDAARDVRQRLRDLGSLPRPLAAGLHVVPPIKPGPGMTPSFAALAEQMAAENLIVYRHDQKVAQQPLFIDYLRNSREATAIAPYATRARPGATVRRR